jgi:4-hydroxybenzoate polyprenyltransferase
MAVWFFQKHKIQSSLPKALVTHNPVQMILNIYIISFVIIKFKPYIPYVSLYNIMAIFTLYFPAFIWEISRKLRAPQDETEYVTYSKLFGVSKPTTLIEIVTIVDIITNMILVWNLNKYMVIALGLNTLWMTVKFEQFKKDPTRFKMVDKVEIYTYIQESMMIFTIVLYLIVGKL